MGDVIPEKLPLEGWPRKSHFDYFRTFKHPYLEVCARVDVTALKHHSKTTGESLFAHMMHHVMSATNAVPELRQRILGDELVEYPLVHPSFTILTDDEAVNFCVADYMEDRGAFFEEMRRRSETLRKDNTLYLDGDQRSDLVYVTSLPWLDFQSIGHAWSGDASDSTPRIAWGKIVEREGRAEVSVQLSAHHSLVDGLHVARFFKHLETWPVAPL